VIRPNQTQDTNRRSACPPSAGWQFRSALALILALFSAAGSSLAQEQAISASRILPEDLLQDSRPYISGFHGETNATSRVIFHPPDHDWRLNVGGSYYGFTYYGLKGPEIGRGTWIVCSRHSLRIQLHIYAVLVGIGALVLIPFGIGWRLTGKGAYDAGQRT
jgi:hypothetical protein